MSEFITHTLSDIRGGRESWRVVLFFSVPSFMIAVVFVAARSAF